MGAVRYDSGFYYVIVAYQRTSDVFLFPLITGVLSELKMVTSFFVIISEQSESHSCPIEKSLVLFIFVYEWDCVAAYGNAGRVKWPKIVV